MPRHPNQKPHVVRKRLKPPPKAKVIAAEAEILRLRGIIPCASCKEAGAVWWYDREGKQVDALQYSKRGVSPWRIRLILHSSYRPLCGTCEEKLSRKTIGFLPTHTQSKQGKAPVRKSDEVRRLEQRCIVLKLRALNTKLEDRERKAAWRMFAAFAKKLNTQLEAEAAEDVTQE